MRVYLNALIMLVATIAVFIALAKLAQQLRSGRFPRTWQGRATTARSGPPDLMQIEQSVMLDSKRRLVAVRCGPHRLVLLTGGPADLVVSTSAIEPCHGGQP